MSTAQLCVRIAVFAGFAACASAADFQGVLMDRACSSKADVRVAPGPRIEGGMVVAEAHDRDCLLMPDCQKSGYGVYTSDNKFYSFDEAGNKKALEAIKASKKLDDFEVQITGDLKGDTLKVATLKLLP